MPGQQPTRVIFMQSTAPPKPPEGAACNGCGVCCVAAPCPLGALLSRRLHGACAALDWSAEAGRYRCGVITSPRNWLPWLPQRWTRRLALRWIASSKGCDSDLEAA